MLYSPATPGTIIPAAPGWYIQETDGHAVVLDPVIAWKVTSNGDEETLLPFVGGGPSAAPTLIDTFEHWKRTVVYRPNHDPGEVGADL